VSSSPASLYAHSHIQDSGFASPIVLQEDIRRGSTSGTFRTIDLSIHTLHEVLTCSHNFGAWSSTSSGI
jgi:hypothetical protein